MTSNFDWRQLSATSFCLAFLLSVIPNIRKGMAFLFSVIPNIRKGMAFLFACAILASCTSNINNMKDITVVESDEETGLTIFKTSDDLYGVARADGDVVIEPEYSEITLHGHFVMARLSDRTFDEETQKMVDEADGKVEKMEHEFLVPGYGNLYYRLFTSDGEMLKDFSRGGTAYWTPLMGDSIIWKSDLNVDPARNCLQLINVEGETTDITDFDVAPQSWGYTTTDGTLHTIGADGKPAEMWGTKIGEEPGFIITKGYASNPNSDALSIFTTGGKYCYIDGYDPIRYRYDKESEGLFVKALEGEEAEGESRGFHARPQKYFYITSKGEVTGLPEGYYEKNVYGNDVDLYDSEGRLVSGYGWNP